MNVRVKISALWMSTLVVFAYVDLFSLYRPDVRADIAAGEVGGFTIGKTFLLGTTVYVIIPALMIFLTLVLRPRINRIANVVLAVIFALTCLGSAFGEWGYYLLGTGIEVLLLGAVTFYAWTWPKTAMTSPTETGNATARAVSIASRGASDERQ